MNQVINSFFYQAISQKLFSRNRYYQDWIQSIDMVLTNRIYEFLLEISFINQIAHLYKEKLQVMACVNN